MRQINITLDLYSAVICAILFCYLWAEKSAKDKLYFSFMMMCVFNFGMAVCDIPKWAFEGTARPWYPAVLWMGSVIYYLCSGLLILAFTLYAVDWLLPKAKVRKLFLCMVSGLCGVQVVCSVLSFWNGMYFTVAEGNIYRRGSYFWVSQTILLLICVIDVAVMVHHRRQLQRKALVVWFGYIGIPLVTGVIQMVNSGIALFNTAMTLSILLMFINIQSERELRLKRQEKELEEARIDIMQSQIQPHFLYNTLTTIRHLCDIDSQKAKAAIGDFAMFLRGNMDSLTSRAPIPFEQELKHTENYLNLEQQRFQSRLRIIYEITVCDFYVPPLVLQPIVENAVRHGVLRREEGGTVTIRTEKSEGAFQIIVSDDGVGFDAQPNSKERQNHVGIANVRERLEALCGGSLDIQSAAGIGATVTITIPKGCGKKENNVL